MRRRLTEPVRSGAIPLDLADPIIEDLLDRDDIALAIEHAQRAGSEVWPWLTVRAWRRWRDHLAALDLASAAIEHLDRTVPRYRDRQAFAARLRLDYQLENEPWNG